MGLLDDAIRDHLELKRQHGASEEEIERAEHEALAPARRDSTVGAGVPELEQIEGEPADIPPPPPPPPVEEDVAAEAPPVDEPVYADEYAAEPGPADADSDADFDVEPPPRAAPIPYEDDEDADYLAPEPVVGHGPAAHPPLESTEPVDESEPLEDSELEEAPPPGTPKPHGDPALDEEPEPDEVPSEEQFDEPEAPSDPYRARTSILDDPLGDSEPPPPVQDQPTQQRPLPDTPPDDAGEQDVLEETPDFLQETPEHDKLWFEQKPPRDFDFD